MAASTTQLLILTSCALSVITSGVPIAPEEPTKYNKNKGRIVWMVKQ